MPDRFLREVTIERENIEKFIARGECSDHADYKFHCGRVMAMKKIEQALADYINKQHSIEDNE